MDQPAIVPAGIANLGALRSAQSRELDRDPGKMDGPEAAEGVALAIVSCVCCQLAHAAAVRSTSGSASCALGLGCSASGVCSSAEGDWVFSDGASAAAVAMAKVSGAAGSAVCIAMRVGA